MLTQRLGSGTQKNESFITAFIAAVRSNPGSCDEVWLASDYGFPKPEKHRESAARLASVAARLRAAGLRVSLQISNTVGHGQYMSAQDCSGLVFEGSKAEHMVGHDGTEAGYCFCWNGENFRRYVRDFVGEYVRAVRPHTVWVDDDLRASNHSPVEFGCFCDGCMAKFNAFCGGSFTREELVRLINYEDMALRGKYIEFLRRSLYDFTRLVSEAVHESSPESYMGLQYCAHGAYDGYGYDHIFSAMRDATGLPPKSRPGGGAYSDADPNEFVRKSQFISYQNSMLPSYVAEKRPEIENLPDVMFGKSIAGTAFETSLYLASGNNAMSYAMLMADTEPMEWHSRMLAEFARERPYWKRLCGYSSVPGSFQGGLRLYISKDLFRTRLEPGQRAMYDWNGEPWQEGCSLARCGIPISYDNGDDPVYLVTGRSAARFTKEDAEFLAGRPCICDGAALRAVRALLPDAFGAEALPVPAGKLYSVFSEHPVNAGIAGRTWSQSFFYRDAFALRDLDGGTEPLSVYLTGALDAEPFFPGEKYPYGIADAVITARGGAKWAVFGQNPWNSIISSDRRRQILAAAGLLRPGCLCAELETPAQALLLPRQDAAGRTLSLSVVNLTVGESGPLRLSINNPAGGSLYVMSQREPLARPLPFERSGDRISFTLGSVAPWSVATIFAE